MKQKTSSRIERERRTVTAMIRIYCQAHHGGEEIPCGRCKDLEAYASCRLDRCPYDSDKPTCAACPIHCYQPEMRERVTEVMRFAGPRMPKRHPILAIRHLIDQRKKPLPIPKKNR